MLSLSLVLSNKESASNAGDNRDSGSVCGSERSTGEGNGDLFQILAGKIPWTKESGRLQSIGLKSPGQLGD